MLTVTLEKNAKQYIEKNNITELYITPQKRRVCCSSYMDFVIMEKPTENSADFILIKEGSLNCYVTPELKIKGESILIGYGKFMSVKRLILKNAIYDL